MSPCLGSAQRLATVTYAIDVNGSFDGDVIADQRVRHHTFCGLRANRPMYQDQIESCQQLQLGDWCSRAALLGCGRDRVSNFFFWQV
jgi:hypothetical protein